MLAQIIYSLFTVYRTLETNIMMQEAKIKKTFCEIAPETTTG